MCEESHPLRGSLGRLVGASLGEGDLVKHFNPVYKKTNQTDY